MSDRYTDQETDLMAKAAKLLADAENSNRDALTDDETREFEQIQRQLGDISEARDGNAAFLRRRDRDRALLAERLANGSVQVESWSDQFDRDPLSNPRDLSKVNQRVWEVPPQGRETARELHTRAVSAIEASEGMTDAHREHATTTIERAAGDPDISRAVLALSHPDYVSGWCRMQRGEHHLLEPAERQAIDQVRQIMSDRAMNVGTGAAGGDWVPLQLDPSLYVSGDGAIHPFREISTVRISSSSTYRAVSSAQVTASFDAEAAEVSDDSPALAETDISLHRLQTFIPFSIELERTYGGVQNVGNLTAVLGALLNDARHTLESSVFTTGTGTGQPQGVVTALTGGASEVASASTDAFAVGDLYNMVEALPARFRSRARWIMPLEIINEVRQFGTADSHALISRLGDGSPERLLGKPVHEASDMDGTINATQDNYVAIYGDMSNYVIADGIGFQLDFIQHLFGTNGRPTGQRGLYGYSYVGAAVVNTAGLRLLNIT